MTDKRYKIIYEDEWLIVIDKPSGMLVIPTPKKETNTLTDLLNQELDGRGLEVNAYPCHRLDRETSGLIIYAKGKSAQRLMMNEFKSRSVKKTYIAFVHGIVRKNFDTIRSHIYNKKKKRDESAITKYRVIERRKNFASRNLSKYNGGFMRGFSVLEVEPVTGRMNQIRIHLKDIGHPLLGESVYAFRKDFDLRFKRVALHAKSIEFTHPVTKARLRFTSPLTEDMEAFKGYESKKTQ